MVEQDFREMKEPGANVAASICSLTCSWIGEISRTGQPGTVRKTHSAGGGCWLTYRCHRIRPSPSRGIPDWYKTMSEQERWVAQTQFWEAIAKTCADRPGVFCCNLMNEPIVSGSQRPTGEWMPRRQ